MSENTAIEWATHTFNPWEGCTKVGPGCDHCYAEARNARYAGGVSVNWGPGVPRRRTSVSNWQKPIKWNANSDAYFAEHGHRQRVFCSSLADVFDNEVPIEWRQDLFDLIADTPDLDWLLLTKRIGNVNAMLPENWGPKYGHVWIGATIVNQAEADRDIPKLLQVKAIVRFLSMEPLLGQVNITRYIQLTDENSSQEFRWANGWAYNKCSGGFRGKTWYGDSTYSPEPGIHWVIVGGESGKGARPMHPDWARSLRDQCHDAQIPFLFKQWGEWAPRDEWSFQRPDKQIAIKLDGSVVSIDEVPQDIGGHRFYLAGKKEAGRLLDGITHDAVYVDLYA